jgi:cytochrome b561
MRFAAHAVHRALYVLLFAMPISGYLMSNALGFPVVLYGFIPLPDPVGPNRALGFQLLALHFWMGMALLALFGMHLGAALFHHFVLRDRTLSRMLPGRMLPRRSGGSA